MVYEVQNYMVYEYKNNVEAQNENLDTGTRMNKIRNKAN